MTPPRALAAALALAALLLAAAACGGSSSSTTTTTTTTAPTTATTRAGSSGTVDLAGLTTYPTVQAMGEALNAAGIVCTLEYEGLRDADREVSICTINGEQALLTVWVDPALLADFVASPDIAEGVVAVGQNWTVDLSTRPTADAVAAALGGVALG